MTPEESVVMQVLYSILVFVSLTLIAIVIALFVFALSFYKSALELSTEEEEHHLNRRKELVSKKRKELTDKIGDVNENAFPKELRRELDRFDAELKNIDQLIVKSKNKPKALSARNIVITPVSLLLASIVASGIAIATSGTELLPTLMLIVALLFMAAGLYFIFKSVFLIESFSKTTDLGTLMEQALDRHAMKRQPVVNIRIWDFLLEIEHGGTGEIMYDVFLEHGLIGRNTRVRFGVTEELDFPEEKEVKQYGFDQLGMKNPKYFWQKVGDVNPKSRMLSSFKVKAPDVPGEYSMSYWIRCEEYTGDDTTFKINVT